MSWSKVNSKHRKSLKWWYHKLLCELFYWIEKLTPFEWLHILGYVNYHKHLNKLCKHGFNLYGEPFKHNANA